MFHLTKKKIQKKKGSEMLAFAIILPAICLIILSMVVVAQLCLCRQSLEHALYLSARAAVTSEDYDTALSNMTEVAKSTLTANTFGVEPENIDVSLKLVAGTTNTHSSNITWEKGAMAECKITMGIDRMIVLGPDSMTATMYIMVERPVPTY